MNPRKFDTNIMNGEAKELIKLLDGADNRFIIPVYQRNYDWRELECNQLFKDLTIIISRNHKSHFFGGIVRARLDEGRADDYLIIDGQQRITTILLLLLAIYKNIKEGNVTPIETSLGEKIWKKYIIDEFRPDEHKIRLKLIKNDSIAFDNIVFKTKDEYIKSSNITTNFLFFYRKIKENNISIDQLFEAIKKLIVIDITLHADDDPQLIFESLNSTGLALSEGDKIRNFILMRLDTRLQEEYYNNYWNKIEQNTSYRVSSFIRDYLTLKLNRITSINNVYFTFKDYAFSRVDDGIEQILVDLLSYSMIYKEITTNSTEIPATDKILKRLSTLDMGVTYPFLMALLKYKQDNPSVSQDELLNVLSYVETYIVRRMICDMPTNALNKIFCTLHSDILKLKRDGDTYSSVMIYILQNKKGSGEFPKDEVFEQSFGTKNIYALKSKNKSYLFDRLENGTSVEENDIIKMMSDGTLSIEHIMPQKLSDTWTNDLGAEYERTHTAWLNTIANLTLTGYNSKYSNRPFAQKQNIENGFKQSGLRLNKFIAQCEKWTEAELSERRQELWKLALKLWLYPATKFVPAVKIMDQIGLDDDVDFKRRTISYFNFMGTQYKVYDWADVLLEVAKLLCELNPTIIYGEAEDPANSFFSSDNESGLLKKVADGIYISTNSNTNRKIRLFKQLFAKCKLDESELEFGLNPLINDD